MTLGIFARSHSRSEKVVLTKRRILTRKLCEFHGKSASDPDLRGEGFAVGVAGLREKRSPTPVLSFRTWLVCCSTAHPSSSHPHHWGSHWCQASGTHPASSSFLARPPPPPPPPPPPHPVLHPPPPGVPPGGGQVVPPPPPPPSCPAPPPPPRFHSQ